MMMTARLESWSQRANGTLMARRDGYGASKNRTQVRTAFLTWAFCSERVTGIEPALSAWEADVLPLNYTRACLHCPAGEPACTVFAQISYRTR